MKECFFFDKQQLIYNVAWNTESTKGRCLCPVSQTDKLFNPVHVNITFVEGDM